MCYFINFLIIKYIKTKTVRLAYYFRQQGLGSKTTIFQFINISNLEFILIKNSNQIDFVKNNYMTLDLLVNKDFKSNIMFICLAKTSFNTNQMLILKSFDLRFLL